MTSPPDESTQISTAIIKSDRIGRTHYSQEYRDEVLSAFEKSSLSGPVFAQQCGIKYPTFASWVTKQRQSSSCPKASPSSNAFIIAEFNESEPQSKGLQIQLPSGAVALISSSNQVVLAAELLKALA